MVSSITKHLLAIETTPPYPLATTNHPFIVAAGLGTLNKNLLSLWLFQDRIYAANAYPRFIGSLISHLPFDQPTSVSGFTDGELQRILKLLVFCLENIIREVEFFDKTAKEHGLDLNHWKERKGTRDYTAEMVRISNNGKIEEGLLFLWAMEKVYLDAWSHVHSKLSSHVGGQGAHHHPVKAFADNWSTPQFQKFVDEDLADLVDGIYRNRGEAAVKAAERIWERVVELEEGFWPKEDEEHCLNPV